MDTAGLIETLVKVFIVFGALPAMVIPLVYYERKVSAWIQGRTGPNRVGPYGMMQPVADAVKLFFKEDFIPGGAHKVLFVLAPAISLFTALATFAVIPFGFRLPLFGRDVNCIVADVNVGILYLLAVASLSVYGIILAGWASNNSYSFLGGIRSTAQMVSYELAMSLAVVGVLTSAQSLRLTQVVERQAHGMWNFWWQPLGFLVFLVSIFAETNRIPFDLPEAEAEIVAGFHTEYSSAKFSMFFMAEYINLVTMSALLVTLYLGGPSVPGLWRLGLSPLAESILYVAAFCVKTALVLFLFLWVRWTLPRFRYDQLMRLGWKVMIPLALLNIFWVGLLIVLGVI
jgi:NADH-quinone oxidoreductase subunit H